MTLRIFNSGSGEKEVFKPLRPGTARMYVCGITPYDTTHMGHAFTYVFFDVLSRYLSFKGINVIYTQNVTDIDDDILRKAKEQGRDWKELGNFWTDRFLKDMKGINVLMPTHYVRATDSIPQIVAVVQTLMKKGYAYASKGNIYFNVIKFKSYGSLSHFNKKQMLLLLKERGGDPGDPRKRNQLDFILWQKARKGEPSWESPWGRGRPGWHIECSTMIAEYLGDQIDIHGGGRDLVFPHHESEIAQSESYTGKSPFSKYFMHTAMVMYMGEKMAKSLGNLILVSDLMKTHSPNAIRWMLLSHHYRQTWEYTADQVEDAERYSAKIAKIRQKTRRSSRKGIDRKAVASFIAAMDDDLDTPKALAVIARLLEDQDTQTAIPLLSIMGFLL